MRKLVTVLGILALILVGMSLWPGARIEKLNDLIQEQATALDGAFCRDQELRRSVAKTVG